LQSVLALVGATATVVFSFIFPAGVVLKSSPSTIQLLGACTLLALGALMSGTAVYNHATGQELE
jgi:hypothetical protein